MHQNLRPKPMSQSCLSCCSSTVKATDWTPPTVAIHAVSDSSAGYRFTDVACMMYQMDQHTQLATARSDPLSQASCGASPPLGMCTGAFQGLAIAAPLYSVMVVTPANDTAVPATLARPRALRRSTISIRSAMAMTKVMEATVLTMEVTNVGDVYLRLAKYMFRVKLTLQFHFFSGSLH